LIREFNLKLGEILLEKGKITREQLDKALKDYAGRERRFGGAPQALG